MIETLIPASLTLVGAALAVKLLVAGVRDPSHRPPAPSDERIAACPPRTGER